MADPESRYGIVCSFRPSVYARIKHCQYKMFNLFPTSSPFVSKLGGKSKALSLSWMYSDARVTIEERTDAMIDVKQAVQIAKAKAAEMLDQGSSNLEEIEREVYKGRDVWSITLRIPRDLEQIPVFARLSADPMQYKRFLIDAETGDLLAMKLREVASR